MICPYEIQIVDLEVWRLLDIPFYSLTLSWKLCLTLTIVWIPVVLTLTRISFLWYFGEVSLFPGCWYFYSSHIFVKRTWNIFLITFLSYFGGSNVSLYGFSVLHLLICLMASLISVIYEKTLFLLPQVELNVTSLIMSSSKCSTWLFHWSPSSVINFKWCCDDNEVMSFRLIITFFSSLDSTSATPSGFKEFSYSWPKHNNVSPFSTPVCRGCV